MISFDDALLEIERKRNIHKEMILSKKMLVSSEKNYGVFLDLFEHMFRDLHTITTFTYKAPCSVCLGNLQFHSNRMMTYLLNEKELHIAYYSKKEIRIFFDGDKIQKEDLDLYMSFIDTDLLNKAFELVKKMETDLTTHLLRYLITEKNNYKNRDERINHIDTINEFLENKPFATLSEFEHLMSEAFSYIYLMYDVTIRKINT